MIYPKEYKINGTFWDVDFVINGNDTTAKNQLLALIYNQYKSIRTVLGGRKCQQPKLDKVKVLLNEPETREKVRRTLGYSDEKIDLIVFLAENEMKFVR